MNAKCFECIHFRCDDGCRWCEEHHNMSSCVKCGHYEKKLTPTEVERVSDLMKVWDYLYKNKVYELCDTISLEIGYIKGKCKEDIL